MRLMTLLLISLFALSCGEEDTAKAKEEATADLMASHVNSQERKDCNDDGNFFRLSDKECTDIALADWKCTLKNVEGFLEESAAFDEETFADLEDYLDEGYVVNQCGVDEGSAFVSLYKTESNDSSVGVLVRDLAILAVDDSRD